MALHRPPSAELKAAVVRRLWLHGINIDDRADGFFPDAVLPAWGRRRQDLLTRIYEEGSIPVGH
jgi:hypothetical protein